MEQFVRSKGAERYRHLLEGAREDGSVPEKTWQQTISRLLAQEKRKQKDRAIKLIGLVANLIRSPPF
jgi:hypothetical protein